MRSGVALLAAAALALGLANSSWGPAFLSFWRGDLLPSSIRGPWFGVSLTPHWVVADLLMPVFFFSVGLELRGEVRHGALSQWRLAALPLAATLGGMLGPAIIYLALARAPELHAGWGVPIATDIAFALGVLALLGRRVPRSLRIVLLSLAVIDDLGAVLVIALFYSNGLSVEWLPLAGLGIASVYWLQRRGIRRWLAYVPGALLAWVGSYAAGLHLSVVGVGLGLVMCDEPEPRTEPRASCLKSWVALGILPVFALANAGVVLTGGVGQGQSFTVSLSVGLALLLGKPLGVLSTSWLGVKLGLTRLPDGVGPRELVVLGSVAGIGFTMSLFIAQLAFRERMLLEAAKLGVVAASGVAVLLSLTLGFCLLPRHHSAE